MKPMRAMHEHKNIIYSDRAADMIGPIGKAWRIDPTTTSRKLGKSGECCLAAWFVHAPGYHLWWSNYAISIVHLREMEGVDPPHKQYPEAEYEFIILALCPDTPVDVEEITYCHLQPVNVVYQFDGVTDEQCVWLCQRCVQAVIDGERSPDSDFRRLWESDLKALVDALKEGRLP